MRVEGTILTVYPLPQGTACSALRRGPHFPHKSQFWELLFPQAALAMGFPLALQAAHTSHKQPKSCNPHQFPLAAPAMGSPKPPGQIR